MHTLVFNLNGKEVARHNCVNLHEKIVLVEAWKNGDDSDFFPQDNENMTMDVEYTPDLLTSNKARSIISGRFKSNK